MTNREQFNDHRAAHRVMAFPFGTNVRIPYRGYEISLAADGGDTIICHGDTIVVDCGHINGTSGESILKAMRVVDALVNEVE